MKDGVNGKIGKVKKRKSNRLRFKQTKESVESTPKVEPINESSESNEPNEPEGTSDELKYKPSSSRNNNDTDLNFIEFGPSINGYRFIGKPNASNYFNPKSEPINETKSTYDWSYLKLPQFKSHDDSIECRYSTSHASEDHSLIEYLKQWESIKSQQKGEILFPQDDPNITKQELLNFYKQVDAQSGLSLFELLKNERIKWHPDKMIRSLKLGGDDELKVQITRMFQIVNELYEEMKST